VLASHNPPLAADENDHTHRATAAPNSSRATRCAVAIASSSHARTRSGGGERPVCAPNRSAKRTNSARSLAARARSRRSHPRTVVSGTPTRPRSADARDRPRRSQAPSRSPTRGPSAQPPRTPAATRATPGRSRSDSAAPRTPAPALPSAPAADSSPIQSAAHRSPGSAHRPAPGPRPRAASPRPDVPRRLRSATAQAKRPLSICQEPGGLFPFRRTSSRPPRVRATPPAQRPPARARAKNRAKPFGFRTATTTTTTSSTSTAQIKLYVVKQRGALHFLSIAAPLYQVLRRPIESAGSAREEHPYEKSR
jgi:hypothetical protein